MIKMLLYLALIITALYSSKTFACSPNNFEFTYSYTWKEREKPIYTGDSVPELIDLCPSGCGDPGCSVPDCDDGSIEALRIAQDQIKGFLSFSDSILIPLIIRCVFLLVIIIMTLYLFFMGHFRIRDLWQNTDDKWRNEEDPTAGLEQDVWANLKVIVTQKKDSGEQSIVTEPSTDGIAGAHMTHIARVTKFAKFRKILNLYYGRERFYRLARTFNPMKWELQTFGPLRMKDDLKEKIEKEKKRKELENEDKFYDYDWKEDLFDNDVTKGLLYTVFDEEPEEEAPPVLPESFVNLFKKKTISIRPPKTDDKKKPKK